MNTEQFLAVALVTVVILLVIRELYITANAEHRARLELKTRVREAGDNSRAAFVVLEKLMTDPQWAAQLHVRERVEGERLRTSIDREEIRRNGPAPRPPIQPQSQGVPVEDINQVRPFDGSSQ